MTSLNRNCLKNFSTDFSEILSEDDKLMPDRVLKVSHRYLLSFLAIEKIREGVIFPPPSTARVKCRVKHVLWVIVDAEFDGGILF